MTPTDNELMFQVRDGDVGKLGILFERHHSKLFNFLTRMCGRREVGEDLVQEVFLRILKYRQSFRGEAAFTTWMYQMGRNVAVDHFRKWKDNPGHDEAPYEHTDGDRTPSEMLEHIETHDLLSLALSRLPAEKREVIVLSRFVGMKYDEIGRVLDHPVGTVKARMHHAMKELRDIYLSLSEEAVL